MAPIFDPAKKRGHLLRDWQTDIGHLRAACMFGRVVLGMSLPQLGAFLGCDHTTVLDYLRGGRPTVRPRRTARRTRRGAGPYHRALASLRERHRAEFDALVLREQAAEQLRAGFCCVSCGRDTTIFEAHLCPPCEARHALELFDLQRSA